MAVAADRPSCVAPARGGGDGQPRLSRAAAVGTRANPSRGGSLRFGPGHFVGGQAVSGDRRS